MAFGWKNFRYLETGCTRNFATQDQWKNALGQLQLRIYISLNQNILSQLISLIKSHAFPILSRLISASDKLFMALSG